MLKNFRALPLIQSLSNVVEKGKFAFCATRNIKNMALNQQTIACRNAAQLKKIFHENIKEMNVVNLTTILRNSIFGNLYKNEVIQKRFLIKNILPQIQLCWDQFISNQQNHRHFLQLLMFLGNNKVYDLNNKIMQVDLLQFFNKANQKQKCILLELIIQLNLKKQFNKKYARLKTKILNNTEQVKSRFILVGNLRHQNIINILVYSSPSINIGSLIILWGKIIAKNLDTKYFNNYMVRRIFKSVQIKGKGDQLGLKDYIHLLKAIQAIRDDIKHKDIENIIKNYPKNTQGVTEAQIHIFYSLMTNFAQLKDFIRNQLKLLNEKKLKKGEQSHSQDISQQQNQSSLLKLVQNKAMQQIQNMNLVILNKMVYYIRNMDQFYFNPLIMRKIQQIAINIIRKQDAKSNNQQLISFLINMTNFYKAKKFSQIQYFYKKIVQFTIQKNLDQLKSRHLTALLSFLSQCRQIQCAKQIDLNLTKRARKILFKGNIFGYQRKLRSKICSTLSNPKRIITRKDIFATIKSLSAIRITNKFLCKSINNKIQALQKTQKELNWLRKIKNIKEAQSQYSCGLGLKYCVCKGYQINFKWSSE